MYEYALMANRPQQERKAELFTTKLRYWQSTDQVAKQDGSTTI